MFRFLLPIILIGATIGAFLIFTSPFYNEVSTLRSQAASYNEALDNSKALENERDKLTKKFNSIDPENLEKLEKLLPDNVDNIRLILEIERIAMPYAMTLKNVKYETQKKANTEAALGAVQPEVQDNKEYGTWTLEFSTVATYRNFLNFLRDLENNLRIVDIASIEFSSSTGAGLSPSQGETYNYDFKIKTYWLKN